MTERVLLSAVSLQLTAALEYEEAFCWYAERSEHAANGFDKAVTMGFFGETPNGFLSRWDIR